MIKSFLQAAIILSFFINSPLMVSRIFGQDLETTPLYQCFNLKTQMQGIQFASDNVNVFYPNLNGQIESANLKDGKLNTCCFNT